MGRVTLRRDPKPGGGTIRRYMVEGVECVRLPAKAKNAFIVAGKPVQGRKLHRPGLAESLWVNGRLVGVTVKTVCGSWLVNHISLETDPETFEYCDGCLIEAWPGPCVYRLFDAEGALLYIGCSIRLMDRLISHKAASGDSWAFGRLIAWHTFEVFPDHVSALVAEKIAILNERPKFNKDLTDRAASIARRRAAFTHLVAT